MSVGIASFAQNTKTDSEIRNSSDKAMLDGKAFVVTLSVNATGADGNLNSGGKPIHSKDDAQPNRNDQGMDNGKGNAYGTTDTKTGQKMMIRFENGMVKTSGKDHLKVEKCTYKSWGMESTGISFSADCGSSSSMQNLNRTKDPGTPESVKTSKETQTVTTETTPSGKTNTTVSGETKTGTVTGTTTNEATTTTATVDSKDRTKTQITGTVNGDTIHGTMICTKSDGSVKTYSYTGSKAGKNDLDMESEMGMK